MSRDIEKSLMNKKKDDELLNKILVLIERSQTAVDLELKAICVEIGDNLSKISWNEEDIDCIRNKHGYRNRAKNAGNKKNKDGAKINFEALQNLKDISDISVLGDVEGIRISLSYLSDQIQYVLGKKSSLEDTDPDKKLVKAISLFHDEQCIIKLKALASQDFSKIDLNSKEQRYFLGYNFSQIGELAKELSDYIKPEHYDEATRNPIRFLFGKLGHYRQEIKNNPIILQNKDSKTLLQMKLSFEKFQEDLIKILDLLVKPSQTDVVKLEKENAALIEKLTEKIGQAIQNIPETIKSLEIANVKSSERIIALKKKLAELEATSGKKEGEESKPNQDIIDFFKQSFIGSKAAQKIKHLVQNHCSLETIERLQIESKYKTFLSQLRSLYESSIEVVADSKKEEALKNEITKFYSALEKRLKDYNTIKRSNITLEDLFAIFKEDDSDNTESERLSKIEKVKQDINKAQNQIEKNEKALAPLVIRQKNIDEAAAHHFTDDAEGFEEKSEHSTKLEGLISIITQEMKFLRKIQEEKHSAFLDEAMKMTIGFIGQYFKDLRKIEEVQKYLEADELFAKERGHIIAARHKIMHVPLGGGLEPISVTVSKHLEPWQESIEALKILLLESRDAKDLILDECEDYPRYFAWNSKKIKEEADAYVSVSLIRANVRLTRFTKVISIYDSEAFQSFLLDPENDPSLKIEAILSYFKATQATANNKKTIVENHRLMSILDSILESKDAYLFNRKKYEDVYQDSLAVLLKFNKGIPDEKVILKIKRDNVKLALAIKYLENGKYKEAQSIIEPIVMNVEGNNTKDLEEVLVCYFQMSRYHQIKGHFLEAIKWIEKLETIMDENKEELLVMLGGYTKYTLLQLKVEKCRCYENLGKRLEESGAQNEAKEMLKKCVRIGMEVIQEYDTKGDISVLPLIETHMNLARSWYALNHINKSHNFGVVKNNADIAKALISKIPDSEHERQVYSIWLELMKIYKFLGDIEGFKDAINHARENDCWEGCSEHDLDWLGLTQRELVLLGVKVDELD